MESFPSDSDLQTLKVFPFPESDVLEFKQSTDVSFPKILATLCAFLNTRGGAMLFGIRDTTREIIGITGNIKHVDTFLLLIDNIFHSQLLTTLENEPITIENVKVHNITCHTNRPLIVIHATPDPGKQYKIKDGTMYYRLSASNYRIGTGIRVYTESDLIMKVNDYKVTMMKEYSVIIHSLKNRLEEANTILRSLEDKNTETVSLLHTKILHEKDQTETNMEIQSNTRSIWSYLSCGYL